MNISYHDVYVEKTNITRNLLQQEGTENGRLVYGENIWIKYFDNWIQVFKTRGIKNIITTDCRFKNEIDYIKEQGGIIIKINAPIRNDQRLKRESNGDENIYNLLKINKNINIEDIKEIYEESYNFVCHHLSNIHNDVTIKDKEVLERILYMMNFFEVNEEIEIE